MSWAFVCESFQNRHFVAIDFGKGCKKYLQNNYEMHDHIVGLRNRKMKQLVAEFRAAQGDGGDQAIPRELMTPRIFTFDVHFTPSYVASVAVLSSWRRHGHLQIECNRSNMELLLTQLPEPAAAEYSTQCEPGIFEPNVTWITDPPSVKTEWYDKAERVFHTLEKPVVFDPGMTKKEQQEK